MEDLSMLAQIGIVVVEVEPIKGYKIEFKSLDGNEETDVFSSTTSAKDDFTKFDLIKKNTIAHAIRKLNGNSITLEERKILIFKLQPPVINLLWASYLENIVEPQNKILEELKKK